MKRKIIPKQKFTTYAAFPLISGDVRAYEIQLDLGEDVSGAEFKITAIRSDGKVVEDIGSVSEGIASYTMASSMYSVPGELTVRLSVIHDSSVLTDREIVFEVLESAGQAQQGTTTVSINDSVIMRLSAFEQKLSEKVDKVSGKGLSANDFTNEYKGKLDSLDETIGAQLERVSEAVESVSEGVDAHIEDKGNPHSVTASQVGAYTKTETHALLNQKANKDDISNVYKFKGSVETFDDLPFEYKFTSNGAPTIDGNEIGTFDEETGITSIDYSTTLQQDEQITITIPVEPVRLKPGFYAAPDIKSEGIDQDGYLLRTYFIGNAHTLTGYAHWMSDTEISEIQIIFENYTGGEYNFTIKGRGTITGLVYKVIPDEIDINDESVATYSNTKLLNGWVYNVLDDGMNYAWNGTEWDALGGEHKDAEHREDKSNPHSVTASQVGAYTRTEVLNLLDRKVNKSDISNVYKFKGSVETFDDLSFEYKLIPNGVPTIDGVECGTYDEETKTVIINDSESQPYDDLRIIVPIEPITIPVGYIGITPAIWSEDGAEFWGASFGGFDVEYCMNNHQAIENTKEITVDSITLSYYWGRGTNYEGETFNNFGTVVKLSSVDVRENYDDYDGSVRFFEWDTYVENGLVYNVLDDGMNYAWNGTEWDALGGEHKDLEARADIENLETQMGDVETALESIITIQNELIGGSEV